MGRDTQCTLGRKRMEQMPVDRSKLLMFAINARDALASAYVMDVPENIAQACEQVEALIAQLMEMIETVEV